MSHFTKIQARMESVDAIKEAAYRMGFSSQLDGQCRYYAGVKQMPIVIQLPGKYDLGLEQEGEEYNLMADFYKGDVEQHVGKGATLFWQAYNVERAKMEGAKHGLCVEEKKVQDDIIVFLTDYSTQGHIEVRCKSDGGITVQTVGFPGETCMNYVELEDALGSIQERSYTEEMYDSPCGVPAEIQY